MTANPALASEPPIPAALRDPLKDWPNDDLLIGDEERADFSKGDRVWRASSTGPRCALCSWSMKGPPMRRESGARKSA